MTSLGNQTIENVFFHVRDRETGRMHWMMLKNCTIEGIELNRKVEEEFRSFSFPDEGYVFIPAPVVRTDFTISGSTLETEIGLEGTKYTLHEERYAD